MQLYSTSCGGVARGAVSESVCEASGQGGFFASGQCAVGDFQFDRGVFVDWLFADSDRALYAGGVVHYRIFIDRDFFGATFRGGEEWEGVGRLRLQVRWLRSLQDRIVVLCFPGMSLVPHSIPGCCGCDGFAIKKD